MTNCLGVMGSGVAEIIETYWNVNSVLKKSTIQSAIEIIETYWNVN